MNGRLGRNVRHLGLLAMAGIVAVTMTGCLFDDPRPELRSSAPTPTPTPTPTPFTSDLSQIIGIEVIPTITRPDEPVTVLITYAPGKTSSNIECAIMEEGSVVVSWQSPTEDAYADDPGPLKVIEKKLPEGMADIGHFLVECTSPADDGSYSAEFDITPGGLPPASLPDETLAPSTRAPELASPGSSTPGVVPPGQFAGLTGGDLIFDLASATSDNAAYRQPVDSCWPSGYNNADPSKAIAIDVLGNMTGSCAAKETNDIEYEGLLSGYYVPEVNDVEFTLESLMQIPNVGATGFGVMTKYWITFKGKGSFATPTRATGTATWSLDCVGGDTLGCAPGSAPGAEMTAQGTIDWTMTFAPAP